MSRRAYYFNSITNFILEDDESVLDPESVKEQYKQMIVTANENLTRSEKNEV